MLHEYENFLRQCLQGLFFKHERENSNKTLCFSLVLFLDYSYFWFRFEFWRDADELD